MILSVLKHCGFLLQEKRSRNVSQLIWLDEYSYIFPTDLKEINFLQNCIYLLSSNMKKINLIPHKLVANYINFNIIKQL